MSRSTLLIYDGFVVAAPGANTPILDAEKTRGGFDGGLVMSGYPGVRMLAVSFSLASAGTLKVTKTRDGVTKKIFLKNGATFGTNCGTGPVEIPVTGADTIDFELQAGGIGLDFLQIEGVLSGVR